MKVQLFEGNTNVETYIKNEEANITKANSLDTTIDSFIQNIPSTTTTFLSTLTKHKNTYAALDEFTKKLVVKSEALMAYTDEFIGLIKGIDGLAALPTNSPDLRTKVEQYRTTYNSLSTPSLKMDVKNLEKLMTLEALIEKAKKVEQEIQKIETDQSQQTVTNAISAYGKLTLTEKKYVLKDSVEIMRNWEKMFVDAEKLVSQIDTIDIQRFNNTLFGTVSVMKTDTTNFISSVDKIYQTYEVYKTNYVTPQFDAKTVITNSTLLENYKLLSDTAKPIMALSISSKLENFDTEKANVEKLLAVTDVPSEYGSAINVLRSYVHAIKTEKENALKVQDMINELVTSLDIVKLVAARELYNELSSEAKKAVVNISTLAALETQYKAAINVVNSIEKIDPTSRDFISKTTSAKAAYEQLNSVLKPTVTNYNMLEKLLPFAQLMQDINKIKATSTTFRTDLENARTKFTELTAGVTDPPTEEGSTPVTQQPIDKIMLAKQELFGTYGPKLDAFQAIINAADDMTTKIDELGTKIGKEFMDSLSVLASQYKALDSAIKKSVTNAKALTALEKDFKSALKVFNLIESLPVNTDKMYSKKVVAAEKAYQALAAKPKEYIYNYEALRKVLKVANIIERIDKLKIGSKTFETDVAQLRVEYNDLSPEEQVIVHNISKLVEAEENQTSAENVIALINEAVPTADAYIEKLTAARNEFNKLDRLQQKLVTNSKDLTTRERAVKPVLKLDEDILKLDPSNAKTFLSKYKSAEKVYEKLSLTERTLLLNAELFLGELKTIHQVIFAINAVKPTSKTFVTDVKDARTLYDALSPEYKEKISNVSVLENHELNVLGGEKIDAMIRELSSAAPNEFITKVKEARAAFKALSSSNKKAVTLEGELKAQEKYIKPVEKVITEIEGLSNPKNNLSRQFIKVNSTLQKLDDVQRSYVTNMDKYSNLSNVTYVYELIEKLKPNDRYFQGNLEAAKTVYDKLSQDENQKLTNYYKLQEAQVDIAEAQNMISIIASLSRTSSSYFADIERALAAYKAIPSALKKQVTNYDDLKQAEKDMKAAQKVMKQIEQLDPSARTYESKTKSAYKAYEKLSDDQKGLVTNYSELQSAVFEFGL